MPHPDQVDPGSMFFMGLVLGDMAREEAERSKPATRAELEALRQEVGELRKLLEARDTFLIVGKAALDEYLKLGHSEATRQK